MIILDGVYRVTPMGEDTAFECFIQKQGDVYFLIDLEGIYPSVEVSAELLGKMRPEFVRKEA